MSNYHILAGNKDGNSFQIAMHIPMPNVNNEIGANYRMVLIQWLSVEGTMPRSVVPFIAAAEQAELDACELYEHMTTFYTHPGESLEAKRALLDALYTDATAKVQGILQRMLSYWGFDRDVP